MVGMDSSYASVQQLSKVNCTAFTLPCLFILVLPRFGFWFHFRLKVLGFRLKVFISGFRFKFKGFGFKVKGFRFMFKGFEFKVKGFRFKYKGFSY